MATYAELYDLRNNAPLRNKVTTAVLVAAESLSGGTPSTTQKAWIAKAFGNPEGEATRVLSAVLAKNKDATVAQITGASDVTIQANVDAVVPILIDADAGV